MTKQEKYSHPGRKEDAYEKLNKYNFVNISLLIFKFGSR